MLIKKRLKIETKQIINATANIFFIGAKLVEKINNKLTHCVKTTNILRMFVTVSAFNLSY